MVSDEKKCVLNEKTSSPKHHPFVEAGNPQAQLLAIYQGNDLYV